MLCQHLSARGTLSACESLAHRRALWLAATFAVCSCSGLAGDAAVSVTGYDNVHVRVSDPAKAVEWYVKHLGGSTPTAGQVYFGKALIAVVRTQNPQPSSGSVIDHIGLSFADVDAKVRDCEAAGAKVLTPPRDIPGMLRVAFIEDPWGVKIEMMQDPELLGFHHVHLSVRDPDATLLWYREMFGGESAKYKGKVDGIRYGQVWLFASQSTDTPSPSADRAIMSFGLRVSKIDEATAELKRHGIKFPTEPRQLGDLWYAFAEDPNGVRVELLQRPLQ
jgi:predicted enzyme related to lactoylglutathione lyase